MAGRRSRLRFPGHDHRGLSARFFHRQVETGEEEGEETTRVKPRDKKAVTNAERLPFKVAYVATRITIYIYIYTKYLSL